jgi:DNA-binding MarR family transcriptional regulator
MSRSEAALPFETTHRVRDCCLCLHVQRAARGLARRFDDAFRPVKLNNGQFSLLVSLNRPDPPGMASVADLLGMDRTTLTAALKPLERRGLLKITPDPSDRRSRLLHLTLQGKTLLARAVPIWERTSQHLETLLGDVNPNSLRRNLRSLS